MLTIKRGSTVILTNVNPDQSDYIQKQRGGIDYVTLNFTQIGDAPTDLQLDDSVEVLGVTYYLISQLPTVVKLSDRRYQYECVFEANHYRLKRLKYFYINAGSSSGEFEKAFTITGDLQLFVSLLMLNIEREYAAGVWQIGNVDVTEVKELSFDSQNLLSVMQTLASEFQVEFYVSGTGGRVLNFATRSVNNGLEFAYGQGKGLYGITRSPQDENAPITKLWVYGGTKNLPNGYRDYATRLTLDAPITSPTALPLNEETITFDQVFPSYTGTVTSVGNEFTFTASAIPFNVNDQLISGVVAKVVFLTGLLAGYEIELSSFDNTTKTFVINTVTSETSFVVPSPDIHAEPGDLFTLIDLNMPEVYVDEAEAKLIQFGTEYYNTNNFHKRTYSVLPDKFYFRNKGIHLKVADQVRLIDSALGVDRLIPIESFKTFYAQTMGEWSNELVLSDYPIVDPYTRLVRSQIKQAQQIAPKPPIQSPGVYTFNRIGTFQKEGCASGYEGTFYTHSMRYTSLISNEDAVNIGMSDTLFNIEGQSIANSTGSCVVIQPGYNEIRFSAYNVNRYEPTCVFLNKGDYEPNPQNDIVVFEKISDGKLYKYNVDFNNQLINDGLYFSGYGSSTSITLYQAGVQIGSGDCINGITIT